MKNHQELEAFIERNSLSGRAAARVLDISDRRLAHMLSGKVRVPDHIGLACAALEHGLEPWARSPMSGDLTNPIGARKAPRLSEVTPQLEPAPRRRGDR
jgi:hypothetical protein